MKFEKFVKEKTREELLEEYEYLDSLLYQLRRQEEKDQKALREALDNLNNTQRDLEKTEEKFDDTCAKLQELNTNIKLQ
ncbi:MAG TPA: hypothetical protein PKL13_05100 [bacterium]|nr:hypothetical protein [bacterium]